MRFKDKIVLVTGASQNTGIAIAALFLREGARVCINGPSPEAVQEGAAMLPQGTGENLLAIGADITDAVQVQEMFDTVKRKWGVVDILVNNACDQGIGEPFEKMDPYYFHRVITVNLTGTFMVSQAAVQQMLAAGKEGVIVNLGSNVSMRAIHNRVAYVASKGGVDALTRAMAIDLAPKGIRVNMVAPGYIHTGRWEQLSSETAGRRRKNIPQGRESSMEDIAEAVAFLASDAARSICGERLVVDAGCSAQHLPIDVDV